MKTIIMLPILMLIAVTSQANNCQTTAETEEATETLELKTDTPKHLVGATITITLADGQSSTVPAEKFKVVPRKQQFLVTKTEKTVSKICSAKESEKNKNILSGMVGYGVVPGLEKDVDPPEVEVRSKMGPSLGIQYQRRIGNRWILGVQGQTSGNGSGLLGLEF